MSASGQRSEPAATEAPGFSLSRDAFGRLALRFDDGTLHQSVVAVRAFPVSAPDESIAIVDADGRELAWVERLRGLPEATRTLIEQCLAAREFMPQILRIVAVSGFVTPCTWEVTTDRGDTRFVLPGEEAIRRLSRSALLITDSHGVYYLVRDLAALDRASRRLLDRFL